jgi:hypothetical protein
VATGSDTKIPMSHSIRHFIRHFFEMLVAMAIGMVVLAVAGEGASRQQLVAAAGRRTAAVTA